MNNQEEQNIINFENVGRLVASTIAYPLENAKTLIQIGHEPLAPYKTKTLFGTPVLGLPNIFKYVNHIYQVDGIQGCYRGFIPWLATNIVYKWTENKIRGTFPKQLEENKTEDELTEEERFSLYGFTLYRGVISRTVAVIVSQPLHVVTVRTIAQFVGHETKYTSVIPALWTILKEEGISGLFCGLIPRLLADVFIYTVATTGVFLFHQYIVRDQEARKYVDTIIQYVSSASFYSLTVVGSCMAVTHSGLKAGSPPNMPHYTWWPHCFLHLQSIHQLKRGSSVLWRYYTPVSPQLLNGGR